MGKICKSCRINKPLDEYYNLEASEDGKHYYCKDCCKLKRGAERVKRRDKKSKISNRQRYRAEKAGVTADSHITLARLYERDRGLCHICSRGVPTSQASIDHVIPIVKGGEHTWGNVKLAHRICNQRKGDKLLEENHSGGGKTKVRNSS